MKQRMLNGTLYNFSDKGWKNYLKKMVTEGDADIEQFAASAELELIDISTWTEKNYERAFKEAGGKPESRKRSTSVSS